MAVDKTICPLCGRPNRCQLEVRGSEAGPCWCWEVTADPVALERVPPELRHKVCLCHDCLTGKAPALVPDACAAPENTSL